MSARTYDGAPATLIAAMPNGSNPLRWRGVVETGAETGTEVLTIPVLLSEEFDPSQAEIDYPAPDSPALEAARAAPRNAAADALRPTSLLERHAGRRRHSGPPGRHALWNSPAAGLVFRGRAHYQYRTNRLPGPTGAGES